MGSGGAGSAPPFVNACCVNAVFVGLDPDVRKRPCFRWGWLRSRSTRFVLAVAAEGWMSASLDSSAPLLTWDVFDDVTDLSLHF